MRPCPGVLEVPRPPFFLWPRFHPRRWTTLRHQYPLLQPLHRIILGRLHRGLSPQSLPRRSITRTPRLRLARPRLPRDASPPATSPPLGAGSETTASTPSSPSPSVSGSPSDLVLGEDEPGNDDPMQMPSDNTNLFSAHFRVLRAALRDAPTDQSWERCEEAWSQAVALATEAVRLPPASSGRSSRPVNPFNAADIQRLYRLDGAPYGWSSRGPLADEVLIRLRKAENTAPGSDRLTYHHWKSVDPEARFLSALFNACVHHRRTPDAWRTSRTVLIYKKGDPAVPSNWRPITLSCTASKLYAKCLAARLQTWVMDHHVLSHCQKGFLPYDGVFELNYIFQHRLDAARSGGPDLCAALLDFTNAYGSVPHQALLDALRGSGAGGVFTDLIADLYRGNRTIIVAAEGSSEPVSISAGLCQGCPLSGLLFNLVVDPVIRGVQGDGDAHNILAYAYDLTPLADNPALLQARINRVEALATPLGLSLNPAKCSSLHMSGATPVGIRPTAFTVSGVQIQALADHQPQRLLGRPAGFRLLSRTSSVVDDAIDQARAIFSSMLAWTNL
ncbi:hypothetical protein MTO96_029525 [Rhipicephalus appendiculatus]